MKKYYHLFALVVMVLCGALSARAAEWVWDWPISATKDKETGYANGYYNFGSVAYYDAKLTEQTRTFNGITWTAHFDAGCVLAYTASGQTIGQKGKAVTNAFDMTTDSFSGKIRSVTIEARCELASATAAVAVNGTSYVCDESTASIAGTTLKKLTYTPSGDALEGTLKITLNTEGTTGPSYLKSITVVYDPAQASIDAPTFTPAPGSFDGPVEVSIAGVEGAQILYTTDGSSPKVNGTVYTAPFAINETTTIKAVAKVGEEFSAVAEAKYVIRVSPELSLAKDRYSIELLEEDIIVVNNPNNVEPITFSSSKPQVAAADKYGHIYTFSTGTTTISVKFAGNEIYLPQTLTAEVEVVAKEPLAGLKASVESGKYEGPLAVTFTCTDPRAKAIWYSIGTEKMTLDELGILDEYTIEPSTTLNLSLENSCVVSVQAMGDNVWSEPIFLTYDITTPLKADFSGPESVEILYHNGFDSSEEANEWETSSGSKWQLTNSNSYNVPDFSSINPDSKYSLFHAYANTGDVSVVSSPAVAIPENAKVRFYALFNPIWIHDGNLELYIAEDKEGAEPKKIWDAFLTSQNAATDNANWTQYSVNLSDYAGKKVKFSFAYYLTYGDNVYIDDFEVTSAAPATDHITVVTGQEVKFTNLSTGAPESYSWSFEGADTPTSTEAEPTAIWSCAGSYTVSLTAIKGDESDTCKKTGYVLVRAQAPNALIDVEAPGCYYSPEAALVAPLNKDITFRSASTGVPTEFEWKLPGTDKVMAATEEVTVKYIEAGTYDVDLTVKNDVGTSSTYIHGVKVGQEALVWNIRTDENENLGLTTLGWYGYYGGTNWLDMEAFAEHFEAPAEAAEISAVNIYFGKVTTISPDADITVAITSQTAAGLPGKELASTSLKASQLVDASETYNDPTVFRFEKPVEVNEPFFVTISGIPNNETDSGSDAIAMYTLYRGPGGKNTAYHLIAEMDDNWQPTGEKNWYAQTDDPCSFAIAPLLKYNSVVTGVTPVEADDEAAEPVYYTVSGIRVAAEDLVPGIYVMKRGSKTEKVVIK